MASSSSEKRFRALLQRYLENKVSETEKQFVETYMAYFDTLKDNGASMDDAAWLQLEEGMLEKMHSVMKEGERREPGSSGLAFYRSGIVRFAAAAVLAALVCGGYLLWFRKAEKSGAHPIAALTTDAAPGGNKAILTLSGGRQILLDSAHLGALAREGSANITKTDSGRLAYNMANERPSEVLYNTLTTPQGGQYKLTLPDGTHVWLNAVSSLRYPVSFAGLKQREVSLTGEAYFEVAHDSHQPFLVKTGSQVIEDIGTAFNVNAYGDEQGIKTTLFEGKVEVNNVLLNPGQQAIANNNNIQVQDADLEMAGAWIHNDFIFHNQDLPSVMRLLARWYNVKVIYDHAPSGLHIRAAISRNRNLSEVLQLIAETGMVKFEVTGRTVIVRQ